MIKVFIATGATSEDIAEDLSEAGFAATACETHDGAIVHLPTPNWGAALSGWCKAHCALAWSTPEASEDSDPDPLDIG